MPLCEVQSIPLRNPADGLIDFCLCQRVAQIGRGGASKRDGGLLLSHMEGRCDPHLAPTFFQRRAFHRGTRPGPNERHLAAVVSDTVLAHCRCQLVDIGRILDLQPRSDLRAAAVRATLADIVARRSNCRSSTGND